MALISLKKLKEKLHSPLFHYQCSAYSGVIQRTIVLVTGLTLDEIDDVEPLNNLSEDRILTVKMGRPTHRFICFTHLWSELNGAVRALIEPLLHLVELSIGELITPNNIELCG